jgi:hypothetical protein
VYGNACVSGTARVYGNASVSDTACVSGNACVSGTARVSGGKWEKSPLYIQGTRHALTNSKPGFLSIGCHEHEFKYWKTHYKMIGKSEGYTPTQITEYGIYIDLFCKLGK